MGMRRLRAALFVCCGLVAVLSVNAASQEQAKDPKAMEVVEGFCRYYAELKHFTVELDTVLDITGPGVNREQRTAHRVSVVKPDKFAMTLRRAGEGAVVVSDGTRLYTFLPQIDVCDVEDAPENISALKEKRALGMSFLLRVLLQSDPLDEVTEDVSSLGYGGLEKIGDDAVHHLTIKEPEVDWELWVQAGERPFVRKVAVDLSRALARQGAPANVKVTLTEQYAKWEVAEPPPASRFAFTPPAGTRTLEQYMAEQQQQQQGQPASLVGRPAPDFTLPLLAGGQVKLSDHKGKNVVVLDFWATWCPPCRAELPVVVKLFDGYKDKGVVLIAVNLGEGPAEIRKFLRSLKLDPTVALDSRGTVGRAYQVSGIPQTVIIGRQGIVRAVHTGFAPGMEKTFQKEVDELLAAEGSGKTE